MSTESRSLRRVWTEAAVDLVLVAPLLMLPALAGLYLKWTILEQTGYRQQFVGLEKTGLFRADAAMFLLVVPVVGVLLLRTLRWRLGALTLGLSAVATTVLFGGQLQVVSVLGRPASASVMLDGLWFIRERPYELSQYFGGPAALVSAVVLGTLIGWTWFLVSRGAAVRAAWVRGQRRARVATMAAACCALGGIAPLLVPTPSPANCRCTSSMLTWAAGSLLDASARVVVDDGPRDVAGLQRAFRDLTHTPARHTSAYVGAARDYDVLFVILETAPAELIDLRGSLDDLPGFRRLRDTSFVGLAHHTTAPASNRAYFSIFTSWYPLSGSQDFIQLDRQATPPGLMSNLARHGYAVPRIYNPMVAGTTPLDDERLHAYGFPLVSSPVGVHDSGWRGRWEADEESASALFEELGALAGRNQRYAAALFPQIGHGPWTDVTDGALAPDDVMGHGRALIRLQDQLLVRVFDTIERLGRLDKTIVVVTGDHGLRTRREDPSLQVGRLDARAFQVPLLISVPGVLRQPTPITDVTSHIDVAPTLLDLLGIDTGRELEQGLPVWDEGVRERRTFFWGKWFLGADGFADGGRFRMVQQDTRDAFVADRLRFVDEHRAAPGAERDATLALVDRMERLQQSWTAQLSRAGANTQSTVATLGDTQASAGQAR